MDKVLFKGVIPALISPVYEDGRIREKALRQLLDFLMSHGIHGLYVCGSTGEGILMEDRRRMEILEIVTDHVGGRIPIIAHIGAASLRASTALAQHAQRAGADAVSSIPPIYYSYAEKEILEYYISLASCTDLPFIMYGVAFSGNNLNSAMVEKLLKQINIVGIKWTYHNYYEMQRIKNLHNGNINVINGLDECFVCGLSIGADAGVGSTYNLMPGLFVKLYNAYLIGNVVEARKKQYEINGIIAILIKYGVINGIKEQLNAMGFDVGDCIKPLKKMNDDEKKVFLSEMKQIDFFVQDAL